MTQTPSKQRTIAYWATTALVALPMLGAGFGNLTLAPEVAESMAKLGYPEYFARILGTWKLLGAIALLIPAFPRLKEWAYAGFTFTFTGAAISHLAAGDPLSTAVPPLVLLALALTSWSLRPANRRLADAAASRDAAAPLGEPVAA